MGAGVGDPLRRWVVALKVFLLFVLPLIILLPVWIVTDPTDTQACVIVLFMVLSYVVYPIVWGIGLLFEAYLVEEWFTPKEIYVVGGFSTVVLPILILTPMYNALDVADSVLNCILALIIMLPTVWVPLLSAYIWAPTVELQIRDAKYVDRILVPFVLCL